MAKAKSPKATGTAKRKNVDMDTFIRTWHGSKSVKEVSDKLGIVVGSVQTRAAKYRGAPHFLPLPKMTRSGAKKLDVSAANALLAELSGQNVAQIEAASKALKAESEARAAKRAAKTA